MEVPLQKLYEREAERVNQYFEVRNYKSWNVKVGKIFVQLRFNSGLSSLQTSFENLTPDASENGMLMIVRLINLQNLPLNKNIIWNTSVQFRSEGVLLESKKVLNENNPVFD